MSIELNQPIELSQPIELDPSTKLNQSLCKAIYDSTSNRFIFKRLTDSLITVARKKGCLAGCTMATAITATKIIILAISYFLMEGVARSFEDVARNDDDQIVRIRPLGDAGGWTALVIFSILTVGTLTLKLIREGEYLKLKSICRKWIEENKELILANPKFQATLYQKINDIIDDHSSLCLFSKRSVSRRVKGYKIYKRSGVTEIDLEKQNSKYTKDKKLKSVLYKINSELENVTSTRHYFHRIYEGQKSLKNGGCSKQLCSIILGVAIPIILLLTATFSFIGEFGLGTELFIHREELTDTGHFGEWPFNAFECIAAAFFLHLWCMLYEGDFSLTKNVYAQNINNLEGNPPLRNRLCDIANAALSETSSACQYFKLRLEHQFEKI